MAKKLKSDLKVTKESLIEGYNIFDVENPPTTKKELEVFTQEVIEEIKRDGAINYQDIFEIAKYIWETFGDMSDCTPFYNSLYENLDEKMMLELLYDNFMLQGTEGFELGSEIAINSIREYDGLNNFIRYDLGRFIYDNNDVMTMGGDSLLTLLSRGELIYYVMENFDRKEHVEFFQKVADNNFFNGEIETDIFAWFFDYYAKNWYDDIIDLVREIHANDYNAYVTLVEMLTDMENAGYLSTEGKRFSSEVYEIQYDKDVYDIPSDIKAENSELIYLDNNDVKRFTNDILMALDKFETKNRIDNILYKGQPREKGKIYNDTIQKYLTQVRNGAKKYEIIDGRKVSLPYSYEDEERMNTIQSLLDKSKNDGFISLSDEKSGNDISDKTFLIKLEKDIRQNAILKQYNSKSRYIGTHMQTLISNSNAHFLFHVYIENTDEILNNMEEKKRYRLQKFSKDTTNHQRINNKLIQIGFVRYHITDRDTVWINTIQSDITSAFNLKSERFNNNDLNELYKTCVILTMRKFLRYITEKFNTNPNVVIPTSNTRGELFGEYNKGFTYGYDELPKLFGFEKSTMEETQIMDDIRDYGEDGYYISKSKLGKTYGEKDNAISNLRVWTRGNINESKKRKKCKKKLTPLSEMIDGIINGTIVKESLSNLDKIRFENIITKLKS